MAVLGALNEARASTPEKDRLVERINRATRISTGILENCSFSQLDVLERTIFEDPWKNWDRTVGLTVNQLDKFAKSNEISLDMPSRKASIYMERLMMHTYDAGNTFYYKNDIRRDVLRHENFSDEDLVSVEENLVKEHKIYISHTMIYLMDLVSKEYEIANVISSLKNSTRNNLVCKPPNHDRYEVLTPTQKSVVEAIREGNYVMMTGLPGTGKTFTISVIAAMFGQDDVMLVAPTGKAARRISELSGMQARTVHSVAFQYSMACARIENCLIILDEASMLDVDIAGTFFELIDTDSCKLLIVGDPEQLPAVGPGEFLHDILDSKIGNHFHLTEIKRQEPGSIILSAHAISRGEDIVQGDDGQVFVYECGRDINSVIEQVAASPKWVDAQFLSVLKERGSDIYNPIIQNVVNPGTGKWRKNDKVMHLKNDAAKGVMNGDIGIVSHVVSPQTFNVKYPSVEVSYPSFLHWQVSLAYSFTIHKSQGSEFPFVVIILNRSRITNRNLLYTAITRASKKVLILVEDRDDIAEAIDQTRTYRMTLLKRILSKEKVECC